MCHHVHPVHLRHPQIEEDNIWQKLFDAGECLDTVASFCDDTHVLRRFYVRSYTLAHNLMVVCNQNSYFGLTNPCDWLWLNGISFVVEVCTPANSGRRWQAFWPVHGPMGVRVVQAGGLSAL